MRHYRENYGTTSPSPGFDSNMGNSPSQYPTTTPNHNKLTKPRPNDRADRGPRRNSSSRQNYATESTEPELRTNYESLKDTEARHALRRSLTSTFPETQHNGSRDSTIGVDLSSFTASYRRSRASFEVMSNHSAKSSVDSNQGWGNSNRGTKLPPVQETQPMDVEAAINLLQQLKQSATPEELVALHKALLPTRDTETSTLPASGTAPHLSQFERERTAQVPGLATRGVPGDDVLRRPGETFVEPRQRINEAAGWGRPIDSNSQKRPPPLNLEQQGSEAVSPLSVKRSSDSLGHTGIYKPGTLRVTNGTASPTPSSQGYRPTDRAVSPIALEQKGSDGDLSKVDDFKPSPIIDSFPLPAYDRSLQPVPLRDRHPAYRSLVPPSMYEPISPPSPAQAPSHTSSHSTPTSDQLSNSRSTRESGEDNPRSGRARTRRDTAASAISAISQDYLDHCEIPTTPFEEIPDLPRFATRVSGETPEDEFIEGSRADALYILSGNDRRDIAQNPYLQSRPGVASKSDSGYGSDTSYRSLNRQTSDKTNSSSDRRPSGSTLENTSSDTMTTLQEALKAPPTTESGRKSPMSTLTSKGKKRMTLLRSLTSKTSSTPTLNDVSGIGSNETLVSSTSDRGTDKTQGGGKETNKLKKAMSPSTKSKKSLYGKDSRSKSVPDLSAHMSTTSQNFRESKLHPSSEHREDLRANSPSTTPTKGIFSLGHRGRSRGRQRSSTVGVKNDESEGERNEQRKASYGSETDQSRGRSKSRKRRSLGMFLSGRDDRKSQSPATADPSDGEMTGDGSLDQPVIQPKRRSQILRDRNSQHLGNGLFKTKSYTGMSEEMAAQLARMKSKDRAGRDLMPEFDRPRVARPEKKKEKRSQSQSRLPDRRVEDFIPGWQAVSRPPQQQTNQKPPLAHRPHSTHFEAIPPMPDMPANAQKKALKADRLVADKMGTSPRASPDPTSERPSADSRGQDRAISPRPSRSPVGKREDDAHNEQPQQHLHQAELESESKPNGGWKTVRDPAVFEQKVKGLNADIRSSPLPSPTGSHSGDSDDQHKSRQGSTRQESKQATWEEQSRSWRERRNIANERVQASRVVDTQAAQEHQPREPSKSPSIVVSRYITPQGAAHGPTSPGDRPTDRARQHADQYMDLLHAEQDNPPAVTVPSRNDSAVSTSSKRTDDEAVYHQQRVYETTTDVNLESTTPSEIGQPHRDGTGWVTTTAPPPPHAHQRQQRYQPQTHIRAESASRLNGPLQEPNFEVFELEAPLSPHAFRQQNASPTGRKLPGRYDGGFGYGWDKESGGFIGSAGTRTNGDGSPKKSVKMSEDWGLDLSDVPVFLKKL